MPPPKLQWLGPPAAITASSPSSCIFARSAARRRAYSAGENCS